MLSRSTSTTLTRESSSGRKGRSKSASAVRPARAPKPPSYRLHRPSGQAVVTIGGRDVYLGKYASDESHAGYQRAIREWSVSGGLSASRNPTNLTINELVLRYWEYAKAYYPRHTLEGCVRPAVRRLRAAYGPTLVAEFGPSKLKAFRDQLVEESDSRTGRPLSRGYINKLIRQVKAVMRWAVGEELVAPSVWHGLAAVDALRSGRTKAPERPPVHPVDDAVVEATLPHLPPVVADMVRIQRLTGMRPAEVCGMTISEIDRSGEIWIYRPDRHKTMHHGKVREIPLGPRATEILMAHIQRAAPAAGGVIFSPAAAVAQRRALRRANARTPLTPSRAKRDAKRARSPRLVLNDRYTPTNYGQAIRRAAAAAGVDHWSPNQLRHTRATELRRSFGLDAAAAVLGHSRLETTQIYAERNSALAVEVARKTG